MFTYFLRLKSLVKDWTGLEYDFKELNKEWGKKNRSKKSQIRTIIEVSLIPLAILSATLILALILLYVIVSYVCCRSGKPSVGEVYERY